MTINVRQTVLRLLTEAGPAGLTQTEIRASLPATVSRHTVSGTISVLCAIGAVSRVGKRPGPRGHALAVYAVTGVEIVDARKQREARERAGTPLPEEKWPREVRRAVDTLRRRGWGVWPIDADLWEAGGTRTTDQLLDLADRFGVELVISEARP